MSGWSFPRKGETEQSDFSSDAVRGAECSFLKSEPSEAGPI